MRLLERTYTRFHRAGAGLDEAAKERMAEINERLAHLGTSFSHHLLGDEQDWFMELGEDDRAGLSDSFVAAAKAAAEERGMAGKAIVTLSRSSVEPFLKSSARRDLREKVFRAFTARGDNGNANDNNAIIVEILTLREETARILGFPTYAAYRLTTAVMLGRGLRSRVMFQMSSRESDVDDERDHEEDEADLDERVEVQLLDGLLELVGDDGGHRVLRREQRPRPAGCCR